MTPLLVFLGAGIGGVASVVPCVLATFAGLRIGASLTDRITERRPEIRVLFASGYTDDAILRRGVLDKGAHFIGKPYTISELTRKVRQVLDS